MIEPPASPKPLRVLQITRNLPPLRGGMERLNLHIATELAREFAVAIVGPIGCRAALPSLMDVREIPANPLWLFLWRALLVSVSAIRRFRPDVVMAGSGLVAPYAWLAARVASARMVVYVHGLDLIVPNRVYRWFWLPFIRRADLCIANSAHTAGLASTAGVPASRITVIHPGVDLPIGDVTGAADFRARFRLGERPLLLSVGRLIARKGLLEFVENSLPDIARKHSDVCLVVLGDETPALLHGSSAGLGERIRKRAAEIGLEKNLLFVGSQDDETLFAAYAAADVHVFPVLDVPGDVEGFGMVAVEAAAHGLPTVGFAVGGVPDAVENGVSGNLEPAGDYQSLAASILRYLCKRNDAATRMRARQFAERFSWERFGSTMRQAISRIVMTGPAK